MKQKARSYSANSYRFGFNGKENDEKEWGSSLIQDYGFRLYNPGIGKFLSVDPLRKQYPELTPYQFASNTPIWAIDLDGLEATPSTLSDFLGLSAQQLEQGTERGQYDPNGFKSGANKESYVYDFAMWTFHQMGRPQEWVTNQIEGGIYSSMEYMGWEFGKSHSFSGDINTEADMWNSMRNDFQAVGDAIPEAGATAIMLILDVATARTGASATKTGLTIRAGRFGKDVRKYTVIRSIQKGEKVLDIIEEAKLHTRYENVEVALIQVKGGERMLVSGGRDGINLPGSTEKIYGHTHPNLSRGGNNLPSAADREVLDILDQSRTYIFHDGNMTTIYKGKTSSHDVSTTHYEEKIKKK